MHQFRESLADAVVGLAQEVAFIHSASAHEQQSSIGKQSKQDMSAINDPDPQSRQ